MHFFLILGVALLGRLNWTGLQHVWEIKYLIQSLIYKNHMETVYTSAPIWGNLEAFWRYRGKKGNVMLSL
jgi:hypothetical protein